MKRTLFISLLLCILCLTHTGAQTYYYDSFGNKVNITLNENKVLVNVFKDSDNWTKISERVCANVQPLFKYTSDLKFFSVYITREDFKILTSLDFWEEDSKSVIVTSGFFKEDDKTEYILYPQLLVSLYKAEDIDLLTPYIENYNLKIERIFEWPWNTVTYLLYLTMDSEIGAIECANEIFESGNFIYSVPNVGRPGFFDVSAIPSKISVTTETSSEVYDLYGRKLTSKPAKGIYIQQGKKKIVESR